MRNLVTLVVLLISGLYIASIRADDECKVLRKVIIEPLNTDLSAKDLAFVEVGEEWQNSNEVSWDCVDSTSDSPTLLTAGGDSGEFILALTTHDKLNSRVLSSMPQDELNSAVLNWFTSFTNSTGAERKILLHTTQYVVTALKDYLNNPSLNVDCVPSELWPQVLPPLTQNSSFTGCKHIYLLQSHWSDYEISPSVVTAYLNAFYTVHWANCNSKNRPTVLRVSSDESDSEIAVLSIYTDKTKLLNSDDCYYMLPLVAPHERDARGRSAFVLHDAIHHEGIRVQLAQFFAAQTSVTADAFLAAANDLGDKQTRLTLNSIAPSLPIFIEKMVLGENRDDESDETEETLVEVSLVIVLAILVCVAGFFLYWTYKRRNSRDQVLTINDSTVHNNNNSGDV